MNALEKSVEIQLDNLFGGLSFAFPCLSRPDILTALRAFEERQGNNKRGPAYTSPLLSGQYEWLARERKT